MNKTEVTMKVSQLSGIRQEDCHKIIIALEQVLGEELNASNGVRNAFDKAYKLMGFLKR
ncbi:MAG: hypothetical protein LBV74_23105 [Tannerella sp.]|jgi:hypothetical protein|nr:hypothetical protein [Tannerella sp.]